jgi:hypothetical protein
MKATLFALALVSICLGGCAVARPETQMKSEVPEVLELSSWSWFSLRAKTRFQDRILRDNGSVALVTYDTNTMRRDLNDFAIYLYPSLLLPCTAALVGTSSLTKELTDREVFTGRVDHNDIYRMPDYGEQGPPLCNRSAALPQGYVYPPCPTPDEMATLAEWELELVSFECHNRQLAYRAEQGLHGAYALCSQRGDKTVVICLQQMKDDPKMAEEIFSTFRWIEE